MTRTAILLALALAALPARAPALDGAVTVYGTLLPFVGNGRVTGATPAGLTPATGGATQVAGAAYTGVNVPQRFQVTTGTSNIGFKGGMDVLDEDLQVFFQVESAVSPDGDAPNAWAARNSGVGLRGRFGQVLVGNWDTPYKYAALFVGALRGLSAFDNTLTANPGFGVPGTTTQGGRVNGKADAAFSRRQGNSVQYWTPTVAGVSARVMYGANEGKTAASAAAPSISPAIYSLLLSYANGPLVLRYAYERHQDYFGLAQLGGSAGATLTNTGSTDQGHELVVQVSLPTGTRISVIAERLTYHDKDTTAGAVETYSRNAGLVLVQQRLGAHQLWADLGKAAAGTCKVVGGGDCHTTGLGGAKLALGYSYALTPSADLFAVWYRMVNDRSATYGVLGSPGTVTPGGDTTGLGVGFLYTFSATATAGAPKGTP
jgi:hypothetical protein